MGALISKKISEFCLFRTITDRSIFKSEIPLMTFYLRSNESKGTVFSGKSWGFWCFHNQFVNFWCKLRVLPIIGICCPLIVL